MTEKEFTKANYLVAAICASPTLYHILIDQVIKAGVSELFLHALQSLGNYIFDVRMPNGDDSVTIQMLREVVSAIRKDNCDNDVLSLSVKSLVNILDHELKLNYKV